MTKEDNFKDRIDGSQEDAKDNREDLKKLPSFPSEEELVEWKKQQAIKKQQEQMINDDHSEVTTESVTDKIEGQERTARSVSEDLEDERVEKLLDALLSDENEESSPSVGEPLDNKKMIKASKSQHEKKEVTDYFQHLKEKEKNNLPDDPKTRYQRQSAWSYLTTARKSKKSPVFHDFPDYFYAGFWIRLYAFLVDLICINALSTFFVWLIPTSMINLQGIAIVESIIYLGYFILMTKLTNGQTIGKMIFGIQVVCFNEARLSWETVLIREGACRFMMQVGPFMLAYLVTIFTGKKQHIGDFFSDTSVVTLNTLKAYNGMSQ